jgi:ActR/RegA family two-component response regulator
MTIRRKVIPLQGADDASRTRRAAGSRSAARPRLRRRKPSQALMQRGVHSMPFHATSDFAPTTDAQSRFDAAGDHRQAAPSTALIVDDDAACGLIIGRAAEERGYVPVHAQGYDDAATFLRQQKFACASLDLDLGTCTGIDLFEVIAHYDPKLPILIVSGVDDEQRGEAISRARRHGLNFYSSLPKPMALADLRLAFTFVRLLTLAGSGSCRHEGDPPSL